jgi:hypothetical protein
VRELLAVALAVLAPSPAAPAQAADAGRDRSRRHLLGEAARGEPGPGALEHITGRGSDAAPAGAVAPGGTGSGPLAAKGHIDTTEGTGCAFGQCLTIASPPPPFTVCSSGRRLRSIRRAAQIGWRRVAAHC